MENVQLWQLCLMNSALWSVNVGSVFKQQAKQYSFLSGDENIFEGFHAHASEAYSDK